jgi:peptide/nickel transport system substrate-binding protein
MSLIHLARRRFAVTGLSLSILAGLSLNPLDVQAQANTLMIGLSTPVTTLDPHFHNLSPNNAMARHVFETLIATDSAQRHVPALAESWRALSDTEWEIKLRRGVRFHDGSEFTAADVLATLARVPKVPNSPAAFTVFVRPIVEATAVDSHTLRLRTAAPHPLLPSDLSAVLMLPKSVAESARTEDFNSGKAMIGTGPFRFAEYVAGDRVVLSRNDGYWGQKTGWDRVTFKMITSAPARVAALLAGDVQMIENVPTADIPKLKRDARVELSSAVSNRLIYLHMDSARATNSPFVTTVDGKPMEPNPLRDPRVRRALSMMIDRKAIADRIMEGQAVPAGQLLADQFFGTSRNLKPDAYDPAAAKKLLAEAGYPNGFGLTRPITVTSTMPPLPSRLPSSSPETVSRPSSTRCRPTSSFHAAPRASSRSCSPAGVPSRAIPVRRCVRCSEPSTPRWAWAQLTAVASPMPVWTPSSPRRSPQSMTPSEVCCWQRRARGRSS